MLIVVHAQNNWITLYCPENLGVKQRSVARFMGWRRRTYGALHAAGRKPASVLMTDLNITVSTNQMGCLFTIVYWQIPHGLSPKQTVYKGFLKSHLESFVAFLASKAFSVLNILVNSETHFTLKKDGESTAKNEKKKV